jgi:acetyl-CoA carboxylase biotin carboxylase subunit
MFQKILIANRGEIARRIIFACHELGVRATAVYSEADAHAPYVLEADESYPLPGTSAADTYLNQPLILDIAQACGTEAIHPGYGFLSENADFARACAEHGIVFIGPTPEAMRQLGSKAAARTLAEAVGVPVVPGLDGEGMDDKQLATAAETIGFPLLIKASVGGGGKGMRVVGSAADLPNALQAARKESLSAFGSDHLLLERYFTDIHHVEIQVLGDHHGNLLHLFERECSIQRRHQKIIEESPAPVLRDPATREAMATAAVNLARAANYTNAGTVEFIVDKDGRFYFLEMNTRLQVEHPVTEMVTGLDLAAWQIRIAAGEPLPFVQETSHTESPSSFILHPSSFITQRGHAIECRVYAEDPARDFLPSIGEIVFYQRPSGPGVRVDDGITTGSAVTPYYDPMLAKIITWGHDRPEAIRKMERALRDTIILGVTTNIPYLLDILQEPAFRDGRTPTNYLQNHMGNWQPAQEVDEETLLTLAVFESLQNGGAPRRTTGEATAALPDPWETVGRWRNVN